MSRPRAESGHSAAEFVLVDSAQSMSSWVLVDEPGVPTDVKMRWQAIAAEQDSAIRREKDRAIEGELFRQAEALRRIQAKKEEDLERDVVSRPAPVTLHSLDTDQRLALAVAVESDDQSHVRLQQRQTAEEIMTREALQALRPEQKVRIPTQCGCLGASAHIHKPSCHFYSA